MRTYYAYSHLWVKEYDIYSPNGYYCVSITGSLYSVQDELLSFLELNGLYSEVIE